MLWSRLRCLLQLANSPEFEHSAEDFACRFANKVMKILASTANAPPPVITDRPVVEPLTQFNPLTPEEVATVLKNAPAKQCSLDPVPTLLVKKLSAVFAHMLSVFLVLSWRRFAVHQLLTADTQDPSLENTSLTRDGLLYPMPCMSSANK